MPDRDARVRDDLWKLGRAALRKGRGGAALACGLLSIGCPLKLPTVDVWCGWEWRSQVSGAQAYNNLGQKKPILTSSTTHSACFTMQEDYYLDEADAENPAYMALYAQLVNGAIANCELVGEHLFDDGLAYTDCADVGAPPPQVSVFKSDQSCTRPVGEDNFDNWDICQGYYDCEANETGPDWDCAGESDAAGIDEPGASI